MSFAKEVEIFEKAPNEENIMSCTFKVKFVDNYNVAIIIFVMSERTFNQISNHIDEIIEILNFRKTAQFYFHACLSRHLSFEFEYS